MITRKKILTGLIGDYASESEESDGDEGAQLKTEVVTLAQAIAYESDEDSDAMHSDTEDADCGDGRRSFSRCEMSSR